MQPMENSITQLAKELHAQKISSTELTRYFLQRIKSHEDLNAFITVDEERALEEAKQADERLQSGAATPLTGIPVALKDIFCTKGLLTTCGSKILANFISPYDATVVSKLRQAGVVTLGKTNMDEFAMGSSNENSYYGPVKNPWAARAVPGGSSGGSAAAVAGWLAPAASGTDTGGSIRQPAAFCGITGLKPSYGRVSRFGMIAFASSLDQAGTLTRSAEDSAVFLQHIAGFDPYDSTSVDAPVDNYVETLEQDITGLRIGLPKEFFGDGLDASVADAVHRAIKEYENLGARVVDIELPRSELGIPCYYVLAPAEASSNLARFDGVRYGYRAAEYEDLTDMYIKTRTEGFGDEVQRRIMIGTYALSSGYYDAYYIKAQKLRRLISEDFANAFDKCDVIMGPTTPTTAFDAGSKRDDPVSMYLNDIYTISVNLAGLPGISIPVGFDEAQRPIGLQIIGQYFAEAKLLNVAHRYQQVSDWHTRTPKGFE